MHRRNGLRAGILLAILAPALYAQTGVVRDFNDKIVKEASFTYLDALKQIFPDVEMRDNGTAVARHTIALSHISGDYRDEVYEQDMELSDLEAVWFKHQGRLDLALMVTFQEDINSGTVLGVFQVRPGLKLLTCADIRADRFASFHEPPKLAVSPQQDVLLLSNSHFNSNQGYLIVSVVGLVGTRLKELHSLFILRCNCGEYEFDETPTYRAVPNAQHGMADLLVHVKYERKNQNSRRVTVKHYNGRLVWDEKRKKYVDVTGDLKRLEKFNFNNT